MKMTQLDFDRFNALIENTLEACPDAKKVSISSGHSYIRFIWTVYHVTMDICESKPDMSDYWFVRNLYQYLNDDHIETALKRIIPESEYKSNS